MKQSWLIFVFVIGVLGCSQKHEERMMEASAPAATEALAKESAAMDESSPQDYMSSSAAVEKGDSSRKFIRTADIRFKTQNVIHSTYRIEDITARHGGFVTESRLQSAVNYTRQVNVSKDSALQVTHYTVTAFLTVRVPNTKLDTTLKDIALLVDFLDYRTITANDVALSILSNNLTQRRLTANEQRLTNAIDNRGRKLEETTDAEELLLRTQERADDAKISNLSLKDQISFSTITIQLYESQKIKKELIERDIQYERFEYKQSLGSRLIDAFNGGWEIFCTLIVGIFYLWWLVVLVVAAIVAFKMYRKRSKK